MPQTISQLQTLSQNLWWSWDCQATELFASLAPERWPKVHHNPVALLADLSERERIALEADPQLSAIVAQVYARFMAWMADSQTWASERELPSVLYLSMEFGLHESLRIYSGGLGVLAGDHVRSASDLGLNLRAVGLLYSHGYFLQVLDDGRQVAAYPQIDTGRLPLKPVLTCTGERLLLTLPDGERSYQAQAWRVDVGRVRLYLLDTDLEQNPPELRDVTRSLYGGDSEQRLRQEILLGIGGVRLMQALGERVDVVHLNEGHCAFAPMELAAERVRAGESTESAMASVREQVVFTTHTPVPAGHDRFGWPQIDSLLGPWRDSLGWPQGTLMDLGREHPSDLSEPLCMTVLALNMSRGANGVSALHGEVSREMWAHVGRPIGHITNGVHPTYWTAAPMQALLDAHLPQWRTHWRDRAFWAEGVKQLPDQALWDTRRSLKQILLQKILTHTGQLMDPDALLIGFARRFAPYKRADLIFADPARLESILKQGATLAFAGKAHPRDQKGQELLARVVSWSQDPRFKGQVAFLPGYEMQHGRWMTSGSDLWLNNPRRPREASGTSGQKVVLNGGLNCSILDGWWPEAYDGDNGFAIGDTRSWDSTAEQDAHDAEALYKLLEREVLPSFHEQTQGLPLDWLRRVRHSMATGTPVFNTHRMVADYAETLYRKQP